MSAVPRLPRLTIGSLALAVLGLLIVAALVTAIFAVEWKFLTEHRVDAVVVALLSSLLLFPTGALLAVVSLFRRRQSWRSAASALALNLLGLVALFVTGCMIVAAMAAAAVEAVQAALGGLMALLTTISGE